ncbi:MAG: PEP/pyruvate-binding domain-containing protein [Candidatus Sericytochromatia bacterium]
MSQAAQAAGPVASPIAGGDLGLPSIGGKAASLAAMEAAGLPVPTWFALTTAAFAEGLGPVLTRCDARLRALEAAPEHVAEVSAELRAAVLAVEPPEAIRQAITEALVRHFPPEADLAVRSSAVDEDGQAHAMAGLMDTFLHVRGSAAVFDAVRACWASSYSERALRYRLQRGLPLVGTRMAVVVQAMAEGTVSGVLFTANPVSGKRREAMVSAVYGLGEGLVSGAIDADTWVLDRETGAIAADIVEKRERFAARPDGPGTIRLPVSAEEACRPALTDEQLRALVALGDGLAAERGCPQDLEWTLVGGSFVVLQARPITALPPEPVGHRRMWDNSNIAESYPGVTTPLTYTFVRGVYEVAYQIMLRAFGVSPRWIAERPELFANLLGYMHGRIYYNLTQYYRLGEWFPARDAIKDAFDTMIGVKERKAHGFRAAGLWRLLSREVPQMIAVAAMIGWRYLDWDRENARFLRHFQAIFDRFGALPIGELSPDALLDEYRALERELLRKWRAPMVNDFYAMVFFGALRKLVARYALDATGSLANDLLCGEGGIESTVPIQEVRALADRVNRDPALVALYRGPVAAIQPALESGEHPAFKEALDGYLRRYGFRCMGELKLEVPNFRDDPTFVHAMIQAYMALPPEDHAVREAREQSVRRTAEAAVDHRLAKRPLRRALFGWVLKNARRGLVGRENLRMARSNTFGMIRAIFLTLGRRLAAAGKIDAPEDVFFLELGECFAWIEGRSTTTDMRGLVAIRRAEHRAWEAEAVPGSLETVGSPYVGAQLRAPAAHVPAGDTLQGTGCCPGRVTARARVVLTPEAETRLNGEILVTERTDPGWVLLYPLASGLLIERGSLLSHAAVTARELGLPAIIGVEGLTRRVRDGDLLEMDGSAGTVRLLEEAP